MENLQQKLEDANAAYRAGAPVMSDSEYDAGIERLAEEQPDAPLLFKVGVEVADPTRKTKLPMPMASMNKVKTYAELRKWMELKNIPFDTLLVIMPKFDGISLCVNETTGAAITRGDGEYGQRSDGHFALLQNRFQPGDDILFTCGEVMMPRVVFAEKYAEEFKNPRNLIAGKFNDKQPAEILADAVYIRYGTDSLAGGSKIEELERLNARQACKVPFAAATIDELSDERLAQYFRDFAGDFELDGLIVEVNDRALRERLGRETSTQNPAFARAFKGGNFEEIKESVVTGITWNCSKLGQLKPVIQIEPVVLDGATVTNVTGKNAKNVAALGLGTGAIVRVKRSGMVIPEIVEVIKTVEFEMPVVEGVEIRWSASGIELETCGETEAQSFKKIVSFFEILGADNVSEGILRQLWDNGHRSVKQILALTVDDFLTLENFRDRKAQTTFDSLQNSVKDVRLSLLQHASGCFKTLGSRRLALLEHFETTPTFEQIIEIEGFAETSALEYLAGIAAFNEFIEDLPVTIAAYAPPAPTSGELNGQQFVFTGVRRADLEAKIAEQGGVIGSGVSKNTTYLVMKAIGSGSSKEKKAEQLGVKVITVEHLEQLLG